MKIKFVYSGKGEAKYNPETGEYSWWYEGDDQRVIDFLSELENGRIYYKEAENREQSYSGEDDILQHEHGSQLKSWDEHIEGLAKNLRKLGVDVVYVGEV